MKSLREIVPFIISVVFVLLALVIGIFSAIEGDLFYTKLVCPYTFLITGVFALLFGPILNAMVVILIFITLFQYPVYGLIFSFAKNRPVAILRLMLIHISFSMLAFFVELTQRARN